MSDFVIDFINAIKKREANGSIKCCLNLQKKNSVDRDLYPIKLYDSYFLPESMKLFYSKVESVSVYEPESFEIYPMSDIYNCDERYVVFSKINNSHHIALDLYGYNKISGEFDIVSLENKFIITKTFSSLITNKVWAWIDRKRIIWEEELFEK